MPTCPYCNRSYKQSSHYYTEHVRTCKKNPEWVKLFDIFDKVKEQLEVARTTSLNLGEFFTKVVSIYKLLDIDINITQFPTDIVTQVAYGTTRIGWKGERVKGHIKFKDNTLFSHYYKKNALESSDLDRFFGYWSSNWIPELPLIDRDFSNDFVPLSLLPLAYQEHQKEPSNALKSLEVVAQHAWKEYQKQINNKVESTIYKDPTHIKINSLLESMQNIIKNLQKAQSVNRTNVTLKVKKDNAPQSMEGISIAIGDISYQQYLNRLIGFVPKDTQISKVYNTAVKAIAEFSLFMETHPELLV